METWWWYSNHVLLGHTCMYMYMYECDRKGGEGGREKVGERERGKH